MNRRRTARLLAVAALAAFGTTAVGIGPASAATAPAQVSGTKYLYQDWPTKSVKISWNAVSGATSYVVKYSASSTFSSPIYKDVSSVGAWLPNLTPKKDYYVVVAAKKGSSSGAWSHTWKTHLQAHAVGVFPSVAVKPATDGVTVSWGAVSDASDYQVRASAGPNPNRTPDRWTARWVSWFSAFGKPTLSRTIKGSDADLTKVAYGNPIYVRAQARNTYFNSTYVRQSAQVSAWPTPVTPVATDLPVRFGSYNVLCSGCEIGSTPKWSSRGPAVAANIVANKLDIVTVLEASGYAAEQYGDQVYTDLDRRLTGLTLTDTGKLPNESNQGNRIFYNPAKYTLVAKGNLGGIRDYLKTSVAYSNTPWAEFQAKDAKHTRFLVVAAHYGIPSASYKTARKTLLGDDSAQLIAALAKVNTQKLPVILGGDLNDSRFPENETDGAQPRLVKEGGFYDASASKRRVGTQMSTYNDYKAPSQQIADTNKDGQRIDYILTQGFKGSDSFTNVWNPGTSVIPSDHNLVTAVLHVPAK